MEGSLANITIGIVGFTTKRSFPATEQQQIVLACVVAILGLWSTLGNILTILAITIPKRMMIKCNYFILSLAISDLISGLIASPLWLYRRTWGFNDWAWGDFLCKLFWFVDESTSYCTAQHIALFAMWRLLGVKWPSYFESTKKRTLALALLFIWFISIVFGGFVFSSFYEVADKTDADVGRSWPLCSIRIRDNGVSQHQVYYTFSSTTFMFIPMTMLLLSSTLIVRELFCRSRVNVLKSKQRKLKERRAAAQIALISASFLIGYIPMTAYVMWTTRTKDKDKMLDYWFHVAAYFCLRLSECFNPVVYNIASAKMRKASMEILYRIRTNQWNREQTPRMPKKCFTPRL